MLPALCALVMLFALSCTGYAMSADAVWPEASGSEVEEDGKLVVDSSHIDQGYVMVRIDEGSKNNFKLRLTYENGDTAKIEASLPVREGYNSITYTASLDKSTHTLALTLYDGARENIALSHLSRLPESMTVLLREENGALHYTYEGQTPRHYLCPADSKSILLALSEATEFGKAEAVTGDGVTFVISGNNLRFRAHNWVNEGYDLCNDAILQNTAYNGNFLFRNFDYSSNGFHSSPPLGAKRAQMASAVRTPSSAALVIPPA
jgi:hypothetical protein